MVALEADVGEEENELDVVVVDHVLGRGLIGERRLEGEDVVELQVGGRAGDVEEDLPEQVAGDEVVPRVVAMVAAKGAMLRRVPKAGGGAPLVTNEPKMHGEEHGLERARTTLAIDPGDRPEVVLDSAGREGGGKPLGDDVVEVDEGEVVQESVDVRLGVR